eukprot:g5287.t1
MSARNDLLTNLLQEDKENEDVKKASDLPLPAPILLNKQSSVKEEPPYSPSNELHFFFRVGVPLGLSAICEWGVPPLMAMIFAGHASKNDSSTLQAALGYGRVFYNCTGLMIVLGFMNYFYSNIPNLVGSKRRDRISHYFRRSMVVTTIVMIPFYVLQTASGTIMQAVGVDKDIADKVTPYCCLMIVSNYLLMVEAHIEVIFVNLGYAKCAAFNSFVTGLGVDVLASYYFIYHRQMGTEGAAIAQIIVKTARVLVWIILLTYFRFWKYLTGTRRGALKLFDRSEIALYFSLGVPRVLSFFTGWLVFELQIIALANISHIDKAAKAAGAIWVQCESLLASVQNGWLSATRIRTLNLLGKQGDDVNPGGARRSFLMGCVLSFVIVLVTNCPILIFAKEITNVFSNDSEVRDWLEKLMWCLFLQSQTRVLAINANALLTPLNFGFLAVIFNIIGFYMVGCPIGFVGTLTNAFTRSVHWKMVFCVSTTTIANVILIVLGLVYMFGFLDWSECARHMRERAMNDRKKKLVAMMSDIAADMDEDARGNVGDGADVSSTKPPSGAIPIAPTFESASSVLLGTPASPGIMKQKA